MHVVSYTSDDNRGAFEIPKNFSQISVGSATQIFINEEWLSILGQENQMYQDIRERLRHGYNATQK